MKNNFYDAATRSIISLDREQRPQGWTIKVRGHAGVSDVTA